MANRLFDYPLQGDQKKFSAAARQRAVKYLERQLPKIRDSYELAITAYALAVTGSAETDLAFGKLTQVRGLDFSSWFCFKLPLAVRRRQEESLFKPLAE